jgi:hypothetical protein
LFNNENSGCKGSRVQKFNSKFAMTTKKSNVGGTAGRPSKKGRGSRAFLAYSTSSINPGAILFRTKVVLNLLFVVRETMG